jgi:CRP-like cAMP-binding protein
MIENPKEMFVGALGRTTDHFANRVIQPPVEHSDSGFVIESGIVCLYKNVSAAPLAAVSLRYAGEIVFPNELIGFGVRAMVRGRILRLSSSELDSYLDHRRPSGSPTVMMQRQHRIALEWIARSMLEAPARVAHFLCETAERSGQRGAEWFHLPFTQMQIAEITGQTSVNVNRVLRRLAIEESFVRSGRQFVVDWDALRQFGRFNPSYLT